MRKAWAKFIWIDHGRCANGRQVKVMGKLAGEIRGVYVYILYIYVLNKIP